MYEPLRFRDWYSKTSLSAFKTLFFCATNDFIIPHDVVGAILYGEALLNAQEVYFGAEIRRMFTPTLFSFIPDCRSYLNAIKSMGYQDIVDEFKHHNEEFSQFVRERFSTEPYYTDEVVKKIESLVRPEYMAIIKRYTKKAPVSSEVAHNQDRIINALDHFGIMVKEIEAVSCSSGTQYKVYLVRDKDAAVVRHLSVDLAISLGVPRIRVVTLDDCIGIEGLD